MHYKHKQNSEILYFYLTDILWQFIRPLCSEMETNINGNIFLRQSIRLSPCSEMEININLKIIFIHCYLYQKINKSYSCRPRKVQRLKYNSIVPGELDNAITQRKEMHNNIAQKKPNQIPASCPLTKMRTKSRMLSISIVGLTSFSSQNEMSSSEIYILHSSEIAEQVITISVCNQ